MVVSYQGYLYVHLGNISQSKSILHALAIFHHNHYHWYHTPPSSLRTQPKHSPYHWYSTLLLAHSNIIGVIINMSSKSAENEFSSLLSDPPDQDKIEALVANLRASGLVGDKPPFDKEDEPTPKERLQIMNASTHNCQANRLKFLDEADIHLSSCNPTPAIMFLIYDGREMEKGTTILVKKCPHYRGTATNDNPNSLYNSVVPCRRDNGDPLLRNLDPLHAEEYHKKYINGQHNNIFYVTVYDEKVDGRWDEINDDVPRHATLYEEAHVYSKKANGLRKGAGVPQYVVWCLGEDGKVKRTGWALAKYESIAAMRKSVANGGIGQDRAKSTKKFSDKKFKEGYGKIGGHQGVKWKRMWIEYVEDESKFINQEVMLLENRERYFSAQAGNGVWTKQTTKGGGMDSWLKKG